MLTLKDARDWIISERAVEINGDQERSFLTHDCILYFALFILYFVLCTFFAFLYFMFAFWKSCNGGWEPSFLTHGCILCLCFFVICILYFVFCTLYFVFCTKSAHFSHVVLRPAPHFEPAAVLEIASFDDKLKTRNRLLKILWMKYWWLRILC